MAGSALILGVGPGLGAALVRRFRSAGLKVAAAARNRDKLADLFAADTGVTCHEADATDGACVRSLVADVERTLGPIEVAIANSAAWKVAHVLEMSEADIVSVWRASCMPAFHLTQAAGAAMAERGKGTLLFTGSAAQMRAGAGFGAMAAAKSGLRAFTQAAARELGPRGVHVAYVAIDGPIDSARTRASNANHDRLVHPDGIADIYHMLHAQPRHAWTNEIDVRTFSEWL